VAVVPAFDPIEQFIRVVRLVQHCSPPHLGRCSQRRLQEYAIPPPIVAVCVFFLIRGFATFPSFSWPDPQSVRRFSVVRILNADVVESSLLSPFPSNFLYLLRPVGFADSTPDRWSGFRLFRENLYFFRFSTPSPPLFACPCWNHSIWSTIFIIS